MSESRALTCSDMPTLFTSWLVHLQKQTQLYAFYSWVHTTEFASEKSYVFVAWHSQPAHVSGPQGYFLMNGHRHREVGKDQKI